MALPSHRPVSHRRALVSLVALTVVLGACSASGNGGGEAGPAKSVPTTQADTSSQHRTGKQTFSLVSASYSTVAADIPSKPIASGPAQSAGTLIDIYVLKRTGKSVLLVFGYRNKDADEKKVPATGVDFGSGPADYTVSGVSLFDSTGLKRYLVYLDSEDNCLCSKTSLDDIPRGKSETFAALLPAPPSSVTTVAVQTPLGSVVDVKLNK